MKNWTLPELDQEAEDAGIEIDTVYVNNTCNPDVVGPNVCAKQQTVSIKACFKTIHLISFRENRSYFIRFIIN